MTALDDSGAAARDAAEPDGGAAGTVMDGMQRLSLAAWPPQQRTPTSQPRQSPARALNCSLTRVDSTSESHTVVTGTAPQATHAHSCPDRRGLGCPRFPAWQKRPHASSCIVHAQPLPCKWRMPAVTATASTPDPTAEPWP